MTSRLTVSTLPLTDPVNPPSEAANVRGSTQRDAAAAACNVRVICVGCSVEKYQEQFSFLRDSRFLQDLENDSVDSDLIEEELRALRESASRFRRFADTTRLELYVVP